MHFNIINLQGRGEKLNPIPNPAPLTTRYGTEDKRLHRENDIQVRLEMAAVRYVHTQRFLLETTAFCQHFLQLQHVHSEIAATTAGHRVTTA